MLVSISLYLCKSTNKTEQYMSVVVREGENKRVFVKGSFERVSAMCMQVDPWMEEKCREYASEGYYVIAMASRLVSHIQDRRDMESQMQFEGVLLFRNGLLSESL